MHKSAEGCGPNSVDIDRVKVAVVVGAGWAGLRAAQFLVERGCRLSVFERGTVPVRGTATLHASLLRVPELRIVGGAEVTEVLLGADGAVCGARVQLRRLHAGEFFADCIVDATAEPSSLARWRGCVGYARAEQILAEANLLAFSRRAHGDIGHVE